MTHPASSHHALDIVAEWFSLPNVTALNPARNHLTVFRNMLTAAGVGADLVTDAHIATLAIEHQAELHSNDSDFNRFPGLRWHNPLQT